MGNSSLGWGGGGKPPEMGGSPPGTAPAAAPRLDSFIALPLRPQVAWLQSARENTVSSLEFQCSNILFREANIFSAFCRCSIDNTVTNKRVDNFSAVNIIVSH